MPEGPLGFPRLTSLGPLVEERSRIEKLLIEELEGTGAREIEVTELSEEIAADFTMDMRKPGRYKSSINITDDGLRMWTLRYSRISAFNESQEQIESRFKKAMRRCGYPPGHKLRFVNMAGSKIAPHVESKNTEVVEDIPAEATLKELIDFIDCSSDMFVNEFPENRH